VIGAAERPASPDATPGHPQARLRAFGLDLRADFPAPGLEGEPAGGSRQVRLELVPPDEIEAAWQDGEAEPIAEWRDEHGVLDARLEGHRTLGYRDYTRDYGSYLIDPRGTRVACAPPAGEEWRWQRYLIAQPLPLAAVLHGLEGFHASAVAVEGACAGFVGASQAGKTSLAVNLVLRGAARLMTDDVLVVEPGSGRPVAHPGPGVVSVRNAEAEALGGALARLGRMLGEEADSVRVLVEAERHSLPLGALYLLDRGSAQEIAIERLERPDPRILLASSFNFFVRTAARLTRQLDACARLASAVSVFSLHVPASVGAAQLAEVVERHLRRTLEESG
jgi:hypothetical protein